MPLTLRNGDVYLKRESGKHFAYDVPDIDINDICHVEGLRKALQPTTLRPRAGRKPAFAPARGIPKYKNPCKFRPIMDQSASPCSDTYRAAARYVDLLLSALPSKSHFDHPSIASCIRSLRRQSSRLSASFGCHLVPWSDDIASAFTAIPHGGTLKAWDTFHEIAIRLGLTEAYVSKGRVVVIGATRTKACWKCPRVSCFINIFAVDIRPIVERHCKNNYFLVGKRLGREVIGHPMGSQLSPVLCRMWLAYKELVWLGRYRLLYAEWELWQIVHYMDDIRTFAIVPLVVLPEFVKKFLKTMNRQIYDEAVELEEDSIAPFVGLTIPMEYPICNFWWHPTAKFVHRGSSYTPSASDWMPHPLQHSRGWRPEAITRGIIFAALHKCVTLSSDRQMFCKALLEYLQLIHFQAEVDLQTLHKFCLEWSSHPQRMQFEQPVQCILSLLSHS